MKKPLRTRLKERLEPPLDASTGVGLLTPREHTAVFALVQVLAGDEALDRRGCQRYVDQRTSSVKGLLREYRHAVAALEKGTRQLFGKGSFEDLSLEERDRVVGSILQRYAHEERERRWQRLTRATRENLDALFASRSSRRLRVHVIRDLLKMYYTSAAGWAVVGYTSEFMGKVKAESDPCEVQSLAVEGGEIVLQLSDATFEELDPAALEVSGDHGFTARTKAGRQRATFSRIAYYALTEFIREIDGELVLKVGDRSIPLFRGGEQNGTGPR